MVSTCFTETSEETLQKGSEGFKTWCLSNGMYVNIGKTSVMTIGSRSKLSHTESIRIFLHDELVKEVDNQKLLGVIIDKTLTWDKQIDAVCLNITKRITLLKLLSKYVIRHNLNQYYNAYILPIFDYGCIIWGRCTTTNINRLVKLQKRAARIILQADFYTPSQSMFSELKWLSFPKRVQYHTYIMMYKALNGMTPEYITDLFKKTSVAHNRQLRSVGNDMLSIPRTKTSYYDRSFTVDGAKQWNELPINIKHSPSLLSFKNSIKAYLLLS